MKPSPYAGILLASLGVLMTEILLTRIFSFSIWYHFAYLTISTALLGFGAAGSWLAMRPGLWIRDPGRVAALAAAGAGIALLLAAAVLAPHPIDPARLLEEPLAFGVGLLGYYTAVAVPFFLAGIAVAVPLAAHPERVSGLYAADLLGAGLGCAAAVAALTWLDAAGAISVAAAVFAAAGACYAAPRRLALGLAALALALVVAVPWAGRAIEFRPAASKGLAAAFDLPGGILFTRWSPVNRVDLHTHRVPTASFWSGLGVSSRYRGLHPRALSIQYDGHNGSDVLKVSGADPLAMLDDHLLRTPYLLLKAPRVLVVGVGGGIDVLNALHNGAVHVTGVEIQPITLELHRSMLAEWTGRQLLRPEVKLFADEGRHFVRSRDAVYDLIQITATDTFSAQSTGAYVLAESYLYTVEAFQDYLSRLSDDGIVSVELGDHPFEGPSSPMPFATRLVLTAREALERSGVADPSAHLLVAAQSLASNLLVKRSPFTPEEVERMRSFLETNGFELRMAPGAPGRNALGALVNAGSEERARLLAEHPFDVEPLGDDRPFFFHVLRWKNLFGGEQTLWYTPGSATGLWVLVLMLGQALLVGGPLIFLPLVIGSRPRLQVRETAGFLLYFLALGLGFLLIEISFVQKYVLLLGYPTYSLSVTLFSLLVSAALGAALSRRFATRPRSFLPWLFAATAVLVAVETLALPPLRDRLLAEPFLLRVLATAALQLPLGTCLGMYFPTGVELLRRRDARLVAWAWAVNGVASVVSAVLAVILAMAIGFSGVALVAVGIYAVGTVAVLVSLRHESQLA